MNIVDFLVVPNGVFTEEVEGDFAGLVERDVLAAKRATANSVRLVLSLLIARTKSVLVDEVDSSCALACRCQLRLEICFIICTNSVDIVLQHHQRVVTIGLEQFTFNWRAFSNLSRSLLPLMALVAARKTYLHWPLIFSFQCASQVTVLLLTTDFHVPGILGTGTGSPSPMLITMSSGRTRF